MSLILSRGERVLALIRRECPARTRKDIEKHPGEG